MTRAVARLLPSRDGRPRAVVQCRSMEEARAAGRQLAPGTEPAIVGMRFCLNDPTAPSTYVLRLDARRLP